jgi:hypothetical protein
METFTSSLFIPGRSAFTTMLSSVCEMSTLGFPDGLTIGGERPPGERERPRPHFAFGIDERVDGLPTEGHELRGHDRLPHVLDLERSRRPHADLTGAWCLCVSAANTMASQTTMAMVSRAIICEFLRSHRFARRGGSQVRTAQPQFPVRRGDQR